MKIVEINCETGEEIVRDMSQEEIAIFERDNKSSAEQELKVATAKAALLERLGITEEEAKLLLG